MTLAAGRASGKVVAMLWKLRLFWDRTDKTGLVVAAWSALIVGGLVYGLMTVFAQRETAATRTRDFHASSVDCLARNVYYEARGESLAGQYAVAEVTMNRRNSLGYPKTVCEVIYQKDAFSWTAMRLEAPAGEGWALALKVAQDVYYQRRPAELPGATHYHATYVQPDWSHERQRVARIGRHVFYR